MRGRDEVLVMVAPLQGYRALLAGPRPIGWRALLLRPALVTLIIASFVTLTNVGELLPTLLVGSVVTWSWVVGLQMLIATPLMLLARRLARTLALPTSTRAPVPLSSSIDLFFVGHGPWSLWLMAIAAVGMVQMSRPHLSGLMMIFASAMVPMIWTWVITFAFARTVLQLPIWLAIAWTLVYQALLWACAYLYVGAVTYRLRPFSESAGWLG
jgi:hypothetical protein